jgi:hypothetical protein
MQVYTVELSFTLGAGDEVMMKDLIDEVLWNAADQLKEQRVITEFTTACDSHEVDNLRFLSDSIIDEVIHEEKHERQQEDPHG